MVVFAFVAYRGVEMARAFVSRVYQTRARWITAMSLALLLNDIAAHAPYIGTLNAGVVPLSTVTLLFVIVAFMPFVDSTILVALDLDFFHRNTLHWRQTRVIVYLSLYGIIAIVLLLVVIISLPNPPDWAVPLAKSFPFDALFIGIIGGTFAYSALTLVVCSRRAHDIVFRKHLILLGLVFVFGTTAVLNALAVGNLVIDGALGAVVPFLWYLAAMSLSPIGRIGKEPASSSAQAPITLTPSSPTVGPKLQAEG